MKKILSIVLALALICSLAACGGGSSGSAGGSSGSAGGSSGSAGSGTSGSSGAGSGDSGGGGSEGGSGYNGGSYKLMASSHIAESELGSIFMNEFCDLVEERSDGKITFDRFFASQIANQAESAEGLKNGTIDIAINDWCSMSSINGFKKGDITAMTYLYKDYDHVRAFFHSDEYNQMNEELIDQVGIRALATGSAGFRQVGTKNAPLSSYEDFAGLRIRCPDIAIYVNTFQALDCATTIVANSEVYTALQTGIVDAVENPVAGIYLTSWYEQLDYINETNHIHCDIAMYINEDKYQEMDAEAQALLNECAQEAAEHNITLAEEYNADYRSKCEEAGLVYNTFDLAPVIEIMKDAVWPAYFEAVEDGEELVNAILAMAE